MFQGLASYLTFFVLDSQICLFDAKPLSFSVVSLLNLLHICISKKNGLKMLCPKFNVTGFLVRSIQLQGQAQDVNYDHQGDNEEKIIVEIQIYSLVSYES